MITIIKDVDLFEEIKKYDYLIVTTNTYCSMTNGFEKQVSLDYPYVRDINLSTKYGDINKLGTIIECSKEMSLEKVCEQMGETPPWIKGLLLRADGYECEFYKKD